MNTTQFANWLPTLLEGLLTTSIASVLSIVTAVIWGSLVAILISLENKALTPILRVYTSVFRNSPLLVQMFFLYYALPYVGITMPALMCGVIAITLNEGAFIAEILRGNAKNIPRGEIEAANSMALSKFQIATRIIFPLSFRNSIPMLTGQSSIVIKDTSLFSMIMILDLTRAGSVFYSKFFDTASFYIVGLLYLGLFLVFSLIGKQVEKRISVKR
ncbi:MAG: amino acid ABC transporter permease [Clostridiaceae bacterium]|nr:amino acid ABC transporter permease [Eubacteriales bacterium]